LKPTKGDFVRILIATLGASGATALPWATQAQTAPPATAPRANAGKLEEVVVTATRRTTAAEKVGVALTLLSARDLKVLAPKKLDDLMGTAPNVFIGEEVGAPNQALIFIRGQGYADVEQDQAPPVGVIEDGVAAGTSTGALASLFDVCSVEVDRGPQGIFYGKNTTAGLINITRCLPTRTWGAQVSAGGGSYQDGFARGIFNAPLGADGGIKIATQYHTNGGYVKDIFDGKYGGGDHTFAINADANYDILPWLNGNFSYDHTTQSGGGNPVAFADPETAKVLGVNTTTDPFFNPQTGSPIGLKPWQSDVRPGSVYDSFSNNIYNLTLKADTPIGKLISQTAYLSQLDSDGQDYDGTCQTIPDTNGCKLPYEAGNPLIGAPLEAIRSQSYNQFTQEERLSGSIWQFDYLVGAYYFHSHFTLDQTTDLIPAFGLYTEQSSGQRDSSWSEFGNIDWNPTKTIKISAGVRNIDETKDASTYFYHLQFVSPLPSLGPYEFNKTWSHIITRFNAQWQVLPESLIYANRSEGFRSGGFSVRGTLSESVPGQSNYAPGNNFLAFQPETNTTYEVGLKNRLLGGAVVFNIDAFHNAISDFQQTSVIETPGYGPGTNTYVINIPKVIIKGIEMDAQADIGHFIPALDGLRVSGNIGIQTGSITNGRVNGGQFALGAGGSAGASGSIADLTGTDLQRLPTDNFTIRGVYSHTLGDIGSLTTTLGYSWIAKYVLSDFGPTTPDFQPSYGLLDASATYNWKNYYATLSGKNLTNIAYRQFSLPTVFITSWAPPATVEFEVGAKF
jgi:iron complex outermembrane receptor protein